MVRLWITSHAICLTMVSAPSATPGFSTFLSAPVFDDTHSSLFVFCLTCAPLVLFACLLLLLKPILLAYTHTVGDSLPWSPL